MRSHATGYWLRGAVIDLDELSGAACMPGYYPGSTRIHKLHALAAATGAVIFLLIGLSTRSRQRSGPPNTV
jgi:hypothetical protein